MKRLTYAMIGGASGSFIGPIHRMALRLDAHATCAAGCFSRTAKRNAATAAELGIPPERTYADAHALIAAERGKVNFLSICTTNESHYALAKAALAAGMDVFCEKPLSLTAREAVELARLTRRKRRVLGVPFTYTGYPMVKLARDLVRRGTLGTVDKVVLEYQQGSFRRPGRRSSWKTDPRVAGPSCVVADIGVHGFTLIEYVTGLEVKTLLADLSSFSCRLDDDASILMRLGNRAKAAFVTSKIATGEENGIRLRVYGAKASLYWDQERPNELCLKTPTGPERVYRRAMAGVSALSAAAAGAVRIPAGHPEGFVEALANVYGAFAKAVLTRRPGDFPGAREGVRAMRFVDAALASSRAGGLWTRI